VTDPLVDIIIASLERPGGLPEHLELCLETIRCYTDVPHRILLERSKESAAVNRNRGLRRSVASYVCFLDDDSWVTPEWCTKLLDVLKRNAQIAMVGPKLKLEQGQIFCFGIEYRPPWTFLPVGYGDEDDVKYDIDVEPFAIPSTCLMVRREAIDAVGGFDEGYESCQWEDLDYYLRLRSKGFRGVVTGAVTVYHRHMFRSASYEANSTLFRQTWARTLPEQEARDAQSAACPETRRSQQS
jgi:O-antigen biosynthesis protein